MARKVKFPLEMADGAQVRTIEELKEHFDVESVVGYFTDGRLLNWLQSRYYDDEADKVERLTKDDPQLHKKLCAIFGVESAQDVDPEEIARRQERLNRLKQYTDDREIWNLVDQVAFDQEDLSDLLDENTTLIYLCNNRFTIPLRITDKTYVGIGKAIAVIRTDKPVDFDKLNITFKKVRFDDDYQKIIDAPPTAHKKSDSAFIMSLERTEHFKNQFMRLKKLFSKRDPDKARIMELLHELSKMVEHKRYSKELRLVGDCYKEIGEQQEADECYRKARTFPYVSTTTNSVAKKGSLTSGEHSICAPMPGHIKKIIAKENRFVRAGDVLLKFDARSELWTERKSIATDIDGIVTKIFVCEGQYVKANDPLVIIENKQHY